MENKEKKEDFSKLTLQDFTFSYEKKLKPVLKDISFSLEKGDFMCLCGGNGSGKSTLLKNLMENNFSNLSEKEKARKISFLPQKEEPLWNYSVFDTILTGRYCHTGFFCDYSSDDINAVEKIIEDFGLFRIKNKSIKEISGGEFQKVRIARCFAQESDFIILDEPLSSLDFIACENFMQLLSEKCENAKKTVLLTVHDINIALRYCSTIALIGKYDEKTNSQFFTYGKADDVLIEKNIEKCYQEKLKIYKHPLYNIKQVAF